MSMSPRTLLSKNKRTARLAIGVIAMWAMAGPALTAEAFKKDEVFKLTTAIGVTNTGIGNPKIGDNLDATFYSFDISWVDPMLGKYFLADRSNKAIDVVDTTSNTITQFINPAYAGFTGNNDTSGPDGVLTVHQAGGLTELWVGDSPGKVWVLDASNGANILGAGNFINVTGTTRADELCYDPKNHVIMIASPGESPPFVTFIDTRSHTILSKLVFDGTNGTLNATGGLEQCQWSPKTGKLYQNVPVVDGNAGAVAVIDGKTRKVVHSFPVPLDACALPQGMAIGPQNQILLGCNGPSPDGHRNSIVINANSGAVLAILADLGGADEVWFNEGDGHYVIPNCNTACRAVPSTGQELLGVVDSKGRRLDQTVLIANPATTTGTGPARRIHSVAADPKMNQVYVPIPAVGGGAPTYGPTLCSSAPNKVNTPTDAGGCIAVFTTTNDD